MTTLFTLNKIIGDVDSTINTEVILPVVLEMAKVFGFYFVFHFFYKPYFFFFYWILFFILILKEMNIE